MIFSIGLDAAPKFTGVCIGCSNPGELDTHRGFNSYEMTDRQAFPTAPPTVAPTIAPTAVPTESSDQFDVVGQNLKCPFGSSERLFRTPDNSPLTRAECHQKCFDTAECHYFTLGVNPSNNNYLGICMGCTAASTLQSHSGFTSYEMTEFKEMQEEYSLVGPNMKCPQDGTRLFRSHNSETFSKDECYQKCVDEDDCAYFTLG